MSPRSRLTWLAGSVPPLAERTAVVRGLPVASSPDILPGNANLSRRATRDLDKLSDDDTRRITNDIARLATRTFPGEIKPIKDLPGKPLQADSGRFRILHRWNAGIVEIIAVFQKSTQRVVFKGLKGR